MAKCERLENLAGLECSITNLAKREVRDVALGFNKFAPVGVEVRSAPPDDITFRYVPTPVHPSRPTDAVLSQLMSLIVKISRVDAGAEVRFQMVSTDTDNLRTARHGVRIAEVANSYLMQVDEVLAGRGLTMFGRLKPDQISRAILKGLTPFSPGEVSPGHVPIRLLSTEEERSLAEYSEIKRRYVEIFASVPHSSLLAPVWKIKTEGGEGTIVQFPPVISTSMLSAKVPVPRKGTSATVPIPIPPSYLCEGPSRSCLP